MEEKVACLVKEHLKLYVKDQDALKSLQKKKPYNFRWKIRDIFFFQSEYFILSFKQNVQHLIINTQGYILGLKRPICLRGFEPSFSMGM